MMKQTTISLFIGLFGVASVGCGGQAETTEATSPLTAEETATADVLTALGPQRSVASIRSYRRDNGDLRALVRFSGARNTARVPEIWGDPLMAFDRNAVSFSYFVINRRADGTRDLSCFEGDDLRQARSQPWGCYRASSWRLADFVVSEENRTVEFFEGLIHALGPRPLQISQINPNNQNVPVRWRGNNDQLPEFGPLVFSVLETTPPQFVGATGLYREGRVNLDGGIYLTADGSPVLDENGNQLSPINVVYQRERR